MTPTWRMLICYSSPLLFTEVNEVSVDRLHEQHEGNLVQLGDGRKLPASCNRTMLVFWLTTNTRRPFDHRQLCLKYKVTAGQLHSPVLRGRSWASGAAWTAAAVSVWQMLHSPVSSRSKRDSLNIIKRKKKHHWRKLELPLLTSLDFRVDTSPKFYSYTLINNKLSYKSTITFKFTTRIRKRKIRDSAWYSIVTTERVSE